MSETKVPEKTLTDEEKAIDAAFTGFVKTAMDLHGKVHGQMKQAPWLVRLTKINSSYIQSDNPNGWRKMFGDFYAEHYEEISKDIFIEIGDDEGGVNDGWLKDSTVTEDNGTKKKGGWNRKIGCKGLVIYFSDSPGAKDFSIAITEIYKDACALSESNGDKDVVSASYTARILHDIYALFTATVSKEDPTWKNLNANTNTLKVYIKEILPEGDGSSDIGSGVQGFSKIMASVMKQAGMSTDELDSGGMEKALTETLAGDTVGKMGQVFSRIVQSVSNPDDAKSDGSPGDVMDRLGDVLKDPEVRELLSSTTKETAEKMGELASSIPTASSVGQVPASDTTATPASDTTVDDGDAEDQE